MATALCGVLLAATTVVIERRPNRHHEIAVTVLRSTDHLFDLVFATRRTASGTATLASWPSCREIR